MLLHSDGIIFDLLVVLREYSGGGVTDFMRDEKTLVVLYLADTPLIQFIIRDSWSQ